MLSWHRCLHLQDNFLIKSSLYEENYNIMMTMELRVERPQKHHRLFCSTSLYSFDCFQTLQTKI